MKFWIGLTVVNVLFFLPGYLLNIKNQSNPFSFLVMKNTSFKKYIKRFYSRDFSDPFRIVLEFTIALLIAKWFGFTNQTAIIILAVIATLGFIVTNYTAVMVYIFNRAPVLGRIVLFFQQCVILLIESGDNFNIHYFRIYHLLNFWVI